MFCSRKLIWLAPFILPFMILGLARAVWFCAGAPWADPNSAAFASIAGGFLFTIFVLIFWGADEVFKTTINLDLVKQLQKENLALREALVKND